MTDRPILFSAPMVRALLDGRKTQTRRILKPQPSAICAGFQRVFTDPPHFEAIDANGKPCNAFTGTLGVHPYPPIRFAKGDRLWVRETLRRQYTNGVLGETWLYSADQEVVNLRHGDPRITDMIAWAHHKEGDTCVSIHMPRWASRLTLTVTDVRVQRLQEISEADCVAEGPPNVSGFRYSGPASGLSGLMVVDPENPAVSMTPRTWYRELWDTLNGAGSWDANPWVVAVTFTVERRNIDAARAA